MKQKRTYKLKVLDQADFIVPEDRSEDVEESSIMDSDWELRDTNGKQETSEIYFIVISDN